MNKKILYILSVIGAISVLLGIFSGVYLLRQHNKPKPEVIVETEHDVIEIPTVVEKRIVTKEEIETRLYEIGELSTYAGEYTVNKVVEQARYILDDYAIPGTTNKIDLTCTGVVKVGYAIEEINIRVDNNSQKIYISLPHPSVNDNYVIWDSVTCSEKNSILNPIDFNEYQTLISEIEALGLEKVESENIYEAAENNLKNIIRNFLSAFEDFEIVFM